MDVQQQHVAATDIQSIPAVTPEQIRHGWETMAVAASGLGLSMHDVDSRRWGPMGTRAAGILAQAAAQGLAAGIERSEEVAMSIACTALVTAFASTGRRQAVLDAAWSASPASVSLLLANIPSASPFPAPQLIDAATGKWPAQLAPSVSGAQRDAALPSFSFSPTTQLPEEDLARLVTGISRVLPNASGVDVLLSCAAVLLVWQRLESTGVQNLVMAFPRRSAPGQPPAAERIDIFACRRGLEEDVLPQPAAAAQPAAATTPRRRLH